MNKGLVYVGEFMIQKETEFRTDKFQILAFKILTKCKEEVILGFKKGSREEEMPFETFVDKCNEEISDSNLQLKIVTK